jgi:hypothetical protein
VYTHFLHNIHPPIPFPRHLPLPTVTLMGKTYSTLLFSNFVEQKRKNDIFVYFT